MEDKCALEHGLLYYKDSIPKYELTEDSMEIKIDEKIIKLHRIRALEDFGDVKKRRYRWMGRK